MNTECNGTMPTPAHVRRLIAELNAAGYEVRPILSSPPADDLREALNLLDTLNEHGRIEYDDYCKLHALVSLIGAGHEEPAPARRDIPGFEGTLDAVEALTISPDAGPLGSGHSPRVETAARREDSGGSVEEPSTHLIHGPASSPPAADVREALINAMVMVEVSNGMVEFADDEMDREDAGHLADAIIADPRLYVALSSPPADDVREADIESLEDFMQDWYDRWAGPGETWVVRDMATSIVEEWLPKVRPYGTVTEAEVEAAAEVIAEHRAGTVYPSDRAEARAILEAAREARS